MSRHSPNTLLLLLRPHTHTHTVFGCMYLGRLPCILNKMVKTVVPPVTVGLPLA